MTCARSHTTYGGLVGLKPWLLLLTTDLPKLFLKTSEKYIPDKGVISRIYKELLQLNTKKTRLTPNFKNGTKYLTGTSHKRRVANTIMKIYSTSFIIREMLINNPVRYYTLTKNGSN